MSAPVHWQDITPAQAAVLFPNGAVPDDVILPLTEDGQWCPWPWEPQQLTNAPLGMYHCAYCGSMVMAGLPHPDYSEADWDDCWEG